MAKDRVKSAYYLSLTAVLAIDRMQTELLSKTGKRVEKSELVDAAIVAYCRNKFPQIQV